MKFYFCNVALLCETASILLSAINEYQGQCIEHDHEERITEHIFRSYLVYGLDVFRKTLKRTLSCGS